MFDIMALIECPECNKQVSETAKTCPHCGYKLNADKIKRRNKTILWVILICILVAAAIGIPAYIANEKEKSHKAAAEYLERLEESLIDID